MKTKIAFNDIPNGIERDEMKQVLGGNVASVYKEDSTVVSGRTDLLNGGSATKWFTSVGDKSFIGSGSIYSTNDPKKIKQIMSAITGNTYSYDPKVTWDAKGAHLGELTIYTQKKEVYSTYEPVLRFLADKIEDYGTSVELAGIVAAFFTDGASLLAADGGFNIGLAGTTLNAGLDVYYDNNTDLAQMRIATFIATYGLGKALDKALITGELAGSRELALKLGTLIYGEAWANQMRQKTKND